MTNIAKHRISIPLLLLCVVMAGCSQDEAYNDDASGTEVRFDNTTVLVSSDRTSTRAIDKDDPFNGEYAGLEASENTIYLTHEKPWGDIYMQMKVDEQDKGDIVKYKTESGKNGQLMSQDAGESLKWENSTSPHQFHAWSIPENSGNAIAMNPDGKTGTVHFGPFYDTDKEPLEYFIGTMTEPLTYKDNGLSVSMEFQHLVSKVYIKKLTRITSDGSHHTIDDNISEANHVGYLCITFPDMPQTGTFDTGIDGDVFPPSVVADDVEGKKGIIVKRKRTFHLPPFNFKQYGRFEVTLAEPDNDGLYYMYTYHGHLEDITTLTELKAGEAMALDLILTDGKVTGISVYIVDWNDESDETISIPAKKGIYSIADLKAACGGNWDDYAVKENGEKVIKLYNNLNLTGSDISKIEIPEGYVFDGMGHNIKGNNVTFSTAGTGEVRNVYVNGIPCSKSAGE